MTDTGLYCCTPSTRPSAHFVEGIHEWCGVGRQDVDAESIRRHLRPAKNEVSSGVQPADHGPWGTTHNKPIHPVPAAPYRRTTPLRIVDPIQQRHLEGGSAEHESELGVPQST